MVHNSDADQKPPFRQGKKPYEKREGGFEGDRDAKSWDAKGGDGKTGFKKAFGDKPGGPKGAKGGKPGDKPAFKPKDIQDQKTGERIAKVLARAGLASRREVERLIGLGKIAVNGRILDKPAMLVTPEDVVTIDGQPIRAAEPTRLWRYHKPVGLMTTHKDPQGRPTVFEGLPKDLPRVISVGRLDLNSEGLLLLTNDGELARALEMPSSGWVRQYRARAHGPVTQDKLDKLKDGITVEGVTYGSIDAKLDKAVTKADGRTNNWISVSLYEGKNREVRNVLGALGLQVNRLIRMAYGPFSLGDLALGEVEEVGPRVIRELLADIVPLKNLPPEGASQTRDGFKPRSQSAPEGRRGGGDRFKARPQREDRDGEPAKKWTPKTQSATSDLRPEAGERKPRPYSRPESGASYGAKRPFKPRDGEAGEGRPLRGGSFGEKSFSRGPRKDGPAREGGFATKRDFKPRDGEAGEGRPSRGGSFGEKSFTRGPRKDGPARDGGFAPKRDFKPRDGEAGEGRPAGRSFGEKSFTRGPRKDGPAREGGFAPKRDFKPRDGEAGERPRGERPQGKSFGPKPGGGKSFGPKPGGARPAGPRGAPKGKPGGGMSRPPRPKA